MQRKILVFGFRTLATVLLLVSFLTLLAIRLSDKGDIVDRNQNWILSGFLVALIIFKCSVRISDGLPKYKRVIKTTEELSAEIKKSNLKRIKGERKQDQ